MKFFASCHLHMRALAVLMVLFSLLSSGRTLVPGLCATLNALKDGAPRVSCCGDTCSVKYSSAVAQDIVRAEKKHPECAFCKLAHALVKFQTYAYLDSPSLAIVIAPLPIDDVIICAAPRQFSRPRDPPASVLSS